MFTVRRLAQYEVLEKLGAGGMGEVYRARDPRLRREVAIKLLPAHFASDPVRLARFETEALAASSLAHPNIITVHEVGRTEEGLPFIVMELVRGRTLRELLEARRPLLTRRALDLAVQATEGLARAHAAGIVHRDIKPENIMISEDGFVKILDFGLAKLVEPLSHAERPDTDTDPRGAHALADRPQDESQTAAGAVLGTACYMSPEQAGGLAVDFRSDQFSCGATLYEVATGRRAFARPTTAQTLAAIVEGEPEPIARLNPEVPAPFRWVVERCLAKDPADRYASTLDLARELRTVRDRLGEVTTAVSYPKPRRSFARPWLLAGAGALLLGGAAAIPTVRESALRWAGFPGVPNVRHIAVLPFSVAGGGEAAFVEGLMDTLTSRLTQLERFHGSLWVVPASEVRREQVRSVAEALRTFGINLALTGSAQRTDGRLRLHANLVDGRTLRQIRSTTIEAPTSEAAAWQEDLVDRVVDMLDVEVGPEARKALRAGGTTVPGAYEVYLEGRSHLARFDDLESIQRAIALFQRASQQDPSYALAYAGTGEASWRRYQLTKEVESADLAQKACQKAVALNDLLAPVHVTLGFVHAGTGRHERAIQDFGRALSLDPGNGEASREMALSQEALGRLEQAEATYKKAVALKPDYWAGPNLLAGYYYRHGRYAEAETVFQQALRLAPDNVRVLSNLGGVYQVLGRFDDAQAMLERAVRVRSDPAALSNLSSLHFSRGQFADAARLFERLVAGSQDSLLWRNLAAAYYWSPGERDKARAAYGRAASLAKRERETNPRDPAVLMRLADCTAMMDKGVDARAYAAQALNLAPANVNLMFDAAVIYTHLGDRDLAFDWLCRALRGGFPLERVKQREDLDLADLRGDPRYATLAGTCTKATEVGRKR